MSPQLLEVLEYPEIPTAILEMLEGIQIQSDILLGLAVAAMGFGASLWIREPSDKSIVRTAERWVKVVLWLSLAMLATSAALGFTNGAFRTGYLTEIATGWNGSCKCPIVDAREHFLRGGYFNDLRKSAIGQLFAFGAGILALLVVVAYAHRR